MVYATKGLVGSDVNLHLRLADGWKDLKWPLFNERFFNSGYPYPPAFHISVAVLSSLAFTTPLEVLSLLEVILLPLLLISTFLFVFHFKGIETAVLGVLLMASGPAFLDRGSQVIPQALDLLLFPPLIFSYIKGYRKAFIGIGTYLVYVHWFYTVLPLFGLFCHSIIMKRSKTRDFVWIGALSLPIIIIMFYHAPAMLAESAGLNELQEIAVINDPLFAIKYLGYPLFFTIYIATIHLRFKKLDEFDTVLVFWIIGLLPMIIFFPDRFLGYIAMPLGILGGLVITDLVRSPALRATIAVGLFLFSFFTAYYFNQALLLTGETWMPLNTLSPFVVGLKP